MMHAQGAIYLVFACCILQLYAAPANGPTVSLISDEPLVVNTSVRLRLHGNFSNGWSVRFARNFTNCDAGTTFVGGLDVGNIPASTVGNVVRWTIDDSSDAWVVELRLTAAVENGVVCWSEDSGQTWWVASTQQHTTTFRVWKKFPTAIAVPHTVTVGALVRVLVMQSLPYGSKAVLVLNETSCSGMNPRGAITPIATYSGEGFQFRIAKAYPHVFLCVALPRPPWSIIPFDAAHELVFSKGTERIPTGNTAASKSIEVFASSVRFRRATVACTTAISGARVYCTVEVRNTTLLPITPATVSATVITDGGGVAECPLPAMEALSSTKLAFHFIPQRSGKEGTIKLSFLNAPLLIEPDNATIAYFAAAAAVTVPNITVHTDRIVPWYTQDCSIKKLVVLPTFTYLQHYSATNLLSLAQFNVTGEWVTQYGVYRFVGRQNGTSNGDMHAVTLNASTSGMIFQDVLVPAFAERCALHVHYYFLGLAMLHETSVLVGTVEVLADDALLRSFRIFNYLRQIYIVGTGLREGGLLGDVFTLEQITMEIPIVSSYTTLTVRLSIDHTASEQLYFLEPTLQCAVSAQTARTNLQDIAALQRLYKSIGSPTALANWKTSSVFNGDPCTNHWKGVICRHMRVVELQLTDMDLSGELPPLRELTMLEEVHLSMNRLSGAFPLNNTRLKVVDVSRNELTSLNAAGTFVFAGHRCLQRLRTSFNKLTAFPDAVVGLSQLLELDLSSNQMRSTLPQDFSHLSNLRVLHLSTNNMFGSLPSALPKYAVSLDFSHNQFEGAIPETWNSLENAEFIDLSKNRLNGTVPWNIAEVRTGAQMVFRAEDNYLTGVVPRLSAKLLDLRHNFFECPLMRPEIDTNTSEMNAIVNWGVGDWCDYNSADPGY